MPNCIFCKLDESNKTHIKEYKFWSILLSFNQHTLGSSLIVLKRHIEWFKDITEEEYAEFYSVMKDLENALIKSFNPDKLNYLMLSDNVSHFKFHVIPRYKTSKEFAGKTWIDANWGHMPNLTHDVEDDEVLNKIKTELINAL